VHAAANVAIRLRGARGKPVSALGIVILVSDINEPISHEWREFGSTEINVPASKAFTVGSGAGKINGNGV
jgi:hypothetical protein